MARTRRRLRRRGLTLLVAVLVTLAVLGVAHDVRARAARSATNRASLNLGFAALSASVLASEHTLVTQAGGLLAHPGRLTRVRFGSELNLIEVEGAQLRARVALLASPAIDGDAEGHLITVVDGRVAGLLDVLARAAASVQIPHHAEPWPGVEAVGATLAATNTLWQTTRAALARAPGAAELVASDVGLGATALSADLAAVAAAPSLAPVRSASLAAIAVSPASFPAPRTALVLPPVTTLRLEVTVRNHEYIDQPLSVVVTIDPTAGVGRAATHQETVALGPLDARALAFPPLRVAPGEKATVTVSLSGAPGGAAVAQTRRLSLAVAPTPSP